MANQTPESANIVFVLACPDTPVQKTTKAKFSALRRGVRAISHADHPTRPDIMKRMESGIENKKTGANTTKLSVLSADPTGLLFNNIKSKDHVKRPTMAAKMVEITESMVVFGLEGKTSVRA